MTRVGTGVRFLTAVVVCAIVLTPIWAAVTGSLTKYENLTDPKLFPADLEWSNFLAVWRQIPLGQYLLTSTIYSLGAAVLCGVIGTITGYALSRMTFRGKKLYLYALLVCQVIPLIVVVLPLFRLSQVLGIYDTYVSIIIPLAVVSLPFPIMLMKSYFDGVPIDMEEAAQIDGCTRFQAMWRVVIPTALPGVMTVVAIVFFISWQAFTLPLILANSQDKIPVTVGIFRLLSDISKPWHLIMAASIIAAIPPVLVYFAAQRYIVSGLTAGAVK